MSLTSQYEVLVINMGDEIEKMNLIIKKDEDIITISMNYYNVEFSNKINIKEDATFYEDGKQEKGIGVSNIYNFICHSLENNTTQIEFAYDRNCEYIAFESIFNVDMGGFMSGYHISLIGDDYDKFFMQ